MLKNTPLTTNLAKREIKYKSSGTGSSGIKKNQSYFFNLSVYRGSHVEFFFHFEALKIVGIALESKK